MDGTTRTAGSGRRQREHAARHRALTAAISVDQGAVGDPPRLQDWLTLAMPPDQHKERVTLRLDRRTIRYFRGFGPGYQIRINRVLSAWVEARLAGALNHPEAEAMLTPGPKAAKLQDLLRAAHDQGWDNARNPEFVENRMDRLEAALRAAAEGGVARVAG